MARQREREVEDDDFGTDDKTSKKAGDFNADGTLVKDTDLSNDDTLTDDDDFDEGDDNRIAREQAARDEARRNKARGGKVDDEDGDVDDEIEARVAYDDDEDDDYDAPRGSRRARRNRARREARSQSAAVIQQQEARIRQLEGAVTDMGRAQLGLHAGDIDAQIAGIQGQLETIDGAVERAMTEQNGALMRKALKLRDEANARLALLGAERRRLEVVAQQVPQGQQTQQRQQRQGVVDVDPDAERYSRIFMKRHDWFDPKDNTDEDSQMVKAIDDTLVNEGYNPRTKRYWVELESRVRARGLGAEVSYDHNDDDNDEPAPRRVAPQRRSGGLPPRSRRGSGGNRGGNNAGDRDLPPLAKETLDALGLLEKDGLNEDQLKERQGYINTWRKGLKKARAEGKL
jgi:hypothetical protein